MKRKLKMLAVAALAMQIALAFAAIPQDADRLGKDLTPLGGEKSGNQDGTIPAWKGFEAPLPGWAPKKKRIDYWKHKDEKPVVSIDASNVDKHASKLTPGQIQVIKQVKGYRMDVYPTHRTCDAPAFVQENTKKNLSTAALAPEGWYLKEAYVPGVPFPMPKSGIEAMLNAKYHYRGEGFDVHSMFTAVSPRRGSTDWIKARDDLFWYMPWGKKGSTLLSSLPSVESFVTFAYSEPTALAGQALNITVKANEPGTETFYYFPGQRRVRRMPTYAYDAPQIGFENQYTMDEITILFGTLDRFDWKLVGKKEVFIPYNSFGAYNFDGKYEDFALNDSISPNARRYELHRVWVVEGTVKSGTRHSAPKRTYYIDEDSWAFAGGEDYDAQGKISRVREAYIIPLFELGGACDGNGYAQYNLNDGRYVSDMHATGSGRDILYFMEGKGPKFSPSYYTSESLRARSER